MAYTPQEWRNGDPSTPLSAERLSHIENGIADMEHPTPTWASVTGKPATFPPATHAHATADVTGLDAALAGKAATSHSHAIANVTGLQAALDGKQASGSYATSAALADLAARVEALENAASPPAGD